ncbi:MAG: rhodanese-like domain-containing protein [Acidobacteria bacterium]|nr:rhodanese-like domain-containing protein [Acidobacteriota bacterium]
MMRAIKLLALLLSMTLSAAAQTAEKKHAPPTEGAPETSAAELQRHLGEGKKVLVIDVRSPKEFESGHVPGAVNIPIDELSRRFGEMEVPKETTIVTVCEHGGRSSRAVVELQKLGYKSSSFCKLESWKKEGRKTESGSGKAEKSSKVHRFHCQHGCLSYIETTDLGQVCERCDCGHPYGECMKES